MHFSLIVLLGLVAVDAAPAALDLPTADSTAFLAAVDPSITCDDTSPMGNMQEEYCKAAIDRLPVDQPGDVFYHARSHQYLYPHFSRAAAEERHRLPKIAEYGSCVVEVRLAEGRLVDTSSWRIIKLRLGNVITQCMKAESILRVGGRTITGEQKEIEVLIYAASIPWPGLTQPLRNGTAAIR